jgi:hypothetical protein
MTSYYTPPQTLEDRVLSADTIIVGRVTGIVDQYTDYYDDKGFVQTLYTVSVEEVIKGRLTSKEIRIEVAGDNPLREGEQSVLMLAQDVGVHRDADQFVVSFGGVFTLASDDSIQLQAVTPTTTLKPEQPVLEQTTLSNLRELVQANTQLQAQAVADKQAFAAEIQNTESAVGEDYPQEMPQDSVGGGRSTTLSSGDEA